MWNIKRCFSRGPTDPNTNVQTVRKTAYLSSPHESRNFRDGMSKMGSCTERNYKFISFFNVMTQSTTTNHRSHLGTVVHFLERKA